MRSILSRIGFIGIGNMGKGMVKNLAKVYPLTISDLYTEKCKECINTIGVKDLDIRIANNPYEVAMESEIVLISLSGERASSSVFFEGQNSILKAKKQGGKVNMVIDTSTVSVGFTKDCFEKFNRSGITYIDAPVSGGPLGADSGTLSIMIGSSVVDFDKSASVLNQCGSYVKRLGESGAGTAAKIVNQMLVGIHVAAATEAYHLSTKLGIKDTKILMELLERSWGNSAMVQRTLDQLMKAKQNGLDSLNNSSVPARNFVKDFQIVEKACKLAELDLEFATLVKAKLDKIDNRSLAEYDIAAMRDILLEGKK